MKWLDIVMLKWIWWNWRREYLDLENPRTWNEKIQWIKIYGRDERMTICADKYRVREYVTQKAGSEILNELYGVYEKAEDIDFERLPHSFALKANHTCGGNVFCKDKTRLDREGARKFLKRRLRRDMYQRGGEWCYKNIPRCIVAEKYLEEDGKAPTDYKIFCFNGEPLFISVHIDRFGAHRRNYFDCEWNLLPFAVAEVDSCDAPMPRPARLDEMVQVARKLADDFPFVRVDLYCVQDRIIFGEMTFYPAGGRLAFSPASYDEYWGTQLQLPVRGSATNSR